MNTVPMLDLKLEYEYMKEEIRAAIDRCLGHQRWIKGPEVSELEERISRYLGVKHCIGVASGTDALVIALRALAIKLTGNDYFSPGDEIITTPFTFVATGEAIIHAGATPVFVDIDPDTLNIDPGAIEDYIRDNSARVVGILPVHLYGQSCDMDAIMDIAGRHGLFVLEDAAQAIGCSWKGKRVAGIGDMGALSFFPSKNLGGFGDGGMVTTNNQELADLTRVLLQHGGKDKYYSERVGYNSRLDTLQAAVLLVKMNYLDEMNGRRRKVADLYNAELEGVEGVRTLKSLEESHSVYHQYTILVSDGRRDGLAEHLRDKGISTAVYYAAPLHMMGLFTGKMKVAGSLANTETASRQVISLPVEPLLQDEQVIQVAKEISSFLA